MKPVIEKVRALPDPVCHAEDPEWHAERQKVITGTWMPALLGRDRYKSWDEAYDRYAKGAESDFVENRYAWWGRHSESNNLDAFNDIMGKSLECVSHNYMYVDEERRVGVTLDGLGLVTTCPFDKETFIPTSAPTYWQRDFLEPFEALQAEEPDTLIVVEMKQTGEKNRKLWSSPPENYYIQVQMQLWVLGLTHAALFGRIGADDFRAHLLKADVSLHEEMADAAKRFWEEVDNE